MVQGKVRVTAVAQDIYRITTYHEPWRCSINQYLVVDDEPALVSTGLRDRFEDTWAGIAEVIDPTRLRHVVPLHFEADECGALNEILLRAPHATPLASLRTVLASLADFAVRSPRGLGDGELIDTGRHGLRVFETPYLHAWDGIMLVDEETRVAFTGDLFAQPGRSDVSRDEDRSPIAIEFYRTFYGPPPETYLARALDRLEAQRVAVIAPGHGSALSGNLIPYFRAFRALTGEGRTPRAVQQPAVASR